MWGAFVGLIESAIGALYGVLGSWGLAIILFTILVKVVTWPLTSKQIKSTKAMQELQPRLKAMQEKYKDDREAQTRETMKLYQEMGVNPAMGCLPMLLQFPVWIGLYQAILKLASDGLLGQGFLFIPSLAEPSKTLTGLGWVIDVANLGQNWPYLILPILTVVTQIAMTRYLTPSAPAPTAEGQAPDPTQAMMKQMNLIMPLMFGYFGFVVPAGLSLYWVTNNLLTILQYAIMNRPAVETPLPAPAFAAEGNRIIEVDVKPKEVVSSKGQVNGTSGKRKKRGSQRQDA